MFRVVTTLPTSRSAGDVLLWKDNWNDWFIWYTQFYVRVVAQDESLIDVGHVKIARTGMTEQSAVTNLPDSFHSLDQTWFSIGQTENYYETLNALGPGYRQWLLGALRDCAQDLAILEQNRNEPVLRNSLLRDIEMERVRNRFHRLANGNAALTSYAFKYTLPNNPASADPAPELDFRVTPNSLPATNVHVLIGRNGAGKTRCFDLLSRAFLGLRAPDENSTGTLAPLNSPFPFLTASHGFAGLVTVSFSPFDAYGPLVASTNELKVRYAYVGLIRETADSESKSRTIKSREMLSEELIAGVAACQEGARRDRWARALRVLEADPLFEEENISSVADSPGMDWVEGARQTFNRLSSGHCAVLLSVTKLVELVEEQSLVLIDEPEGHLHPPLLSAFVRALSDLLVHRNGVAIIATHSPVVLQEVPRECVWILTRSGQSVRANRPELETFGENVGILTREVFGLEVVQTGFHRMIADEIKVRSYEQLLERFEYRLGGDARALARALSLVPPSDTDFGAEDD